jgi:hypothetical protein
VKYGGCGEGACFRNVSAARLNIIFCYRSAWATAKAKPQAYLGSSGVTYRKLSYGDSSWASIKLAAAKAHQWRQAQHRAGGVRGAKLVCSWLRLQRHRQCDAGMEVAWRNRRQASSSPLAAGALVSMWRNSQADGYHGILG